MLYLYGAGGHAKVVIDILEQLDLKIEAIIDDSSTAEKIMGYPIFRKDYLETVDDQSELLVTIGYNNVRKKIAESYSFNKVAPIIHPSAVISKYTFIGEGTVIVQGAIIQTETSIGKHCIINTGAIIEHECNIADYVHIARNATLCGNTTIGECTWIGAGAVIAQGVKIGENCTIGMGVVISKDVPSDTVVE